MTKDELLKALKVQNASQEVQGDILAKVLVTVEGRFAGLVDELLSDSQKAELDEKIASSDDPVAIAGWLRDNFSDVAGLYEAVLTDYVHELEDQLIPGVSE